MISLRTTSPGWDEWYAYSSDKTTYYYDYNTSDNGTLVHYGSEEQDYLTDVEAEKAKDFIQRTSSDSQPLFMYLAFSAPHGPYTSAPRHEGMFEEMQAPRPPSFDEADVSDKSSWVRKLSHLGSGGEEDSDEEAGEEGDKAEKSDIDQRFRKRLQTLQALDEMVEGVINERSETGRLENTYLVFTSDNGFLQGEHRITEGKGEPYEESIRVPLAVRGPGVPAGRTTDQMALNIDLGPTFADLAGAALPSSVDGRSLKPTFASDVPSWRTAFLEEFWRGQSLPRQDSVRTSRYKYVYYPDSEEHEPYDLESDSYELENSYSNADRASIDELQSRLDTLKECAGDSCRAAEDGQ
jgi:N-acetylglucosamine-6-sulfatase